MALRNSVRSLMELDSSSLRGTRARAGCPTISRYFAVNIWNHTGYQLYLPKSNICPKVQ
jgi:hypothetical protein